jgi:hypothetical protein
MHQPTSQRYICSQCWKTQGTMESCANCRDYREKHNIGLCTDCGRETEATFVLLCDTCRTGQMPLAKTFALTASLALALLLPLSASAQTVPTWQQPVPDTFAASCSIEDTYEDGTIVASCPDGSTIALDPDGQRWVNAAGIPLRLPGHWYVVE